MNSLLSIHIYRYNNLWVFDDPDVGLVKEPFISGIDTMISHYVNLLQLDECGFTVIFSTSPFPEYHTELQWDYHSMDGNWYRSVELDFSGWLCPAMYLYFNDAPDKLFIKFMP